MFDSARGSEKLTLLQLETSASTSGQNSERYVEVATFSGSIIRRGGNNSFTDGARYTDGASFYCRYFSGIETPFQKKQYRMRYNGSDFDITNITPSRADNFMIIDVKGLPE